MPGGPPETEPTNSAHRVGLQIESEQISLGVGSRTSTAEVRFERGLVEHVNHSNSAIFRRNISC